MFVSPASSPQGEWRPSASDLALDRIASLQAETNRWWARWVRELVSFVESTPEQDLEHADDELGLLLGVSGRTAAGMLSTALEASRLPGLVEAVEEGLLTERHVKALLHELGQFVLDEHQRSAVVAVVLSRLAARTSTTTPGELGREVRRRVLLLDVTAAERRKERAKSDRGVRTWATADDQAAMLLTGPLERIAAMAAAVRDAASTGGAADDRTLDQRMFDAAYCLLTGSRDVEAPGGGDPSVVCPGGWLAQVVVPFSAASGGELELAEVPGLGPVLPSTARELLGQARSLQRVAVDTEGVVIAVDDRVPVPRPLPARVVRATDRVAPAPVDGDPDDAPPEDAAPPPGPGAARHAPLLRERHVEGDPVRGSSSGAAPPVSSYDHVRVDRATGEVLPAPPAEQDDAFLRRALARMASAPVVHRTLTTSAYRIPGRFDRFVAARDRSCVFPGCGQDALACDTDHRVAWPLGPTDVENLQALCRRHHRAKQAGFSVVRLADGTYRWTTRHGRTYDRAPQTC